MIEEKYWNPKLDLLEVPSFQCPSCEIGIVLKEKLIREQSESSKKYEEIYGWELVNGVFTSLVRCSLPKCKEIMTISGTYTITEYFDPKFGHNMYGEKYVIHYVSKPIKLFEIPKELPAQLNKVILESL